MDHLPWNGIEGVNGHGLKASVTRVHDFPVKHAQRIVSAPILLETELPVRQSDPGICHELPHPIHQKHLRYLPNIVQKTQRLVRLYVSRISDQREVNLLPTSWEDSDPKTRVEGGVKRLQFDVVHNSPDPTRDPIGARGPISRPQPMHRHLNFV